MTEFSEPDETAAPFAEDPLGQSAESEWNPARAWLDTAEAYAVLAGQTVTRALFPNQPEGEYPKLAERLVYIGTPIAAAAVVLAAAVRLRNARRLS